MKSSPETRFSMFIALLFNILPRQNRSPLLHKATNNMYIEQLRQVGLLLIQRLEEWALTIWRFWGLHLIPFLKANHIHRICDSGSLLRFIQSSLKEPKHNLRLPRAADQNVSRKAALPHKNKVKLGQWVRESMSYSIKGSRPGGIRRCYCWAAGDRKTRPEHIMIAI